MPIPLDRLEFKLDETRRLYPAVVHSMGLRATLLANALAKGRSLSPEEQDYMYRHKYTQWRCRVRVTPQGVEKHALRWWWFEPKGCRYAMLDAVLLRGDRMPLHFDSHFWGRWGLRTEIMGVMLTNLMGYFRQYPDLPLYQGERFYHKQPEFAAAIDQGLVLARQNGKRIISCDTFKDMALLSANERALWESLRGQDVLWRAV
jgi:hypothetical protein